MSNDFIEMINDIDFLYGFIYEHADLVNNLHDNYNFESFESILAPTNSFANLYHYYSFDFPNLILLILIVIVQKNYGKYVCIIERNSYVLKNIAKSHFNIYYIKFFYLLQKVTKLNISNINRRILEKNIYRSL